MFRLTGSSREVVLPPGRIEYKVKWRIPLELTANIQRNKSK